MIREILQAVGIGCLLAAGILYFTVDSKVPSDIYTQKMQTDFEKIQSSSP